LVPGCDDRAARDLDAFVCGRNAQPIANPRDRLCRLAVVVMDVMAGEVRTKSPVPMTIAVENEALLGAIPAYSEIGCAEEQTQLKRHVEVGCAAGAW
ncbi:MAG TPA: hypothetical protein VF713_14710, partial [Thermoanaerobaculia bacterium]